MVERDGDSAQGFALDMQPPDFRQCRLLGGIWFEVLPVASEPRAVGDVAHALALAPLMPERVAGAFSDGLRAPIERPLP